MFKRLSSSVSWGEKILKIQLSLLFNFTPDYENLICANFP
jgi:hypothetical protein